MSSASPRAGVEYPASYADVRSWYPTDAACLDYLDWLRWPDGFWCPVCRGQAGWKLPDGRWSCGRCGRRVSATAGTIFHATRTPLTVWFAAAWMLVSQKHGISALGLKRTLGIGSEQTAWAMLHRYRSAMVRPGRDRLTGVVEVDETYMGGPEPGRSGRGALGKSLVAIAVEQRGRGIGRCRMQLIPDATAASLREFLLAHIQPGAVVITDGWRSYPPACEDQYEHRPEPIGPSELQTLAPNAAAGDIATDARGAAVVVWATLSIAGINQLTEQVFASVRPPGGAAFAAPEAVSRPSVPSCRGWRSSPQRAAPRSSGSAACRALRSGCASPRDRPPSSGPRSRPRTPWRTGRSRVSSPAGR